MSYNCVMRLCHAIVPCNGVGELCHKFMLWNCVMVYVTKLCHRIVSLYYVMDYVT